MYKFWFVFGGQKDPPHNKHINIYLTALHYIIDSSIHNLPVLQIPFRVIPILCVIYFTLGKELLLSLYACGIIPHWEDCSRWSFLRAWGLHHYPIAFSWFLCWRGSKRPPHVLCTTSMFSQHDGQPIKRLGYWQGQICHAVKRILSCKESVLLGTCITNKWHTKFSVHY